MEKREGLRRLWLNSQRVVVIVKNLHSFLLKSVPEPQQTSQAVKQVKSSFASR